MCTQKTPQPSILNCHETSIFSYHLILYDFADVDRGLCVLSEIPLLLEEKALSALPTQI